MRAKFMRAFAFILTFFITLFSLTDAFAASYEGATMPELSEAEAAMVVDAQGNVIYSLNPEAEFNMASITKVMTAVVALESGLSLDTVITCKGCVLDENAQLAGYVAGQTQTFGDMLKVMLVFSANDAAEEIAFEVAGSEESFVAQMNAKAAELGMTHTNFCNPHGLDAEGHHSSVSDLVKLARYAMTKHPYIAECVGTEEVTVPWNEGTLTLSTTDKFMKEFPGGMGIKTGMGNTTACFLGAARQNGTTLYSCVLGCDTSDGRFNDTTTLMSSAYSELWAIKLADTDKIYASRPFAYHFGWYCAERGAASTIGRIWHADTTTSTRASKDNSSFLELNQIPDVVQWTQDGRVVATATLTTGSQLVQSRSGFGLAEKLLG